MDVDRDITVRLLRGDEVLDEAFASVGRLRVVRPFLLQVELPRTAPAIYRLVYEISSSTGVVGSYAFDVQVPEQRMDVQLTCATPIARPGQLIDFVMRNWGPSTAFFGSEYAVERSDDEGAWLPVSRDEDEIWTLVGHPAGPSSCQLRSRAGPSRGATAW